MPIKPAKDIDAIYASFELDKYNYTELSEDERYHLIKKKWLMLNVMDSEISGIKRRMITSVTAQHE